MKRSCLLGAAAALLAGSVFAAAARASVIELGQTSTAVTAPVCPANLPPSSCTIILTRSTALATIRDGITYPTTVKTAGDLVGFTVGLSALSSDRATRLSDLKFLDHQYGGTTQIAVTVLTPVGKKKARTWKVAAESPLVHVEPYLGEVVQFPLAVALPVLPGDLIALTTPTWAPVLSIDLPTSKFAYRQSRRANCNNPPGQSQAQLTAGMTAQYKCDYPGTRVEYSATEITTPPIPKNYVH